MTAVVAHDATEGLRRRAADIFPGGVNSPVRAFRAVDAEPILLTDGDGARVTDSEGRTFIDYIGGWGPAILGHRHPAVLEAIRAQLDRGFALGLTGPLEVELAERIRARMPSLEQLRFTSSGTEAVMSAIRLARAATGRDLIVKFAGGYHGHSDGLLVEAGSGLATQAIPGSAGIPAAAAAATIVLPYNDQAAVAFAFAQHQRQIAAVIVEPVAANVGVVPPVHGFLEALRELTAANGALLIFDEVITGFRVASGGAQERYGVRPDLTTLGKIIGGGLPIGAYGGRRQLMAHIAPEGAVYQAGTLSGHALTMAAGIATVDALDDGAYEDLEAAGARLAAGLRAAAHDTGRTVSVNRVGSLLTVFFAADAPTDATAALAGDRTAFGRFFRTMLTEGVLLPPSPFEAWFISLAHDDVTIDETIRAAHLAFAT